MAEAEAADFAKLMVRTLVRRAQARVEVRPAPWEHEYNWSGPLCIWGQGCTVRGCFRKSRLAGWVLGLRLWLLLRSCFSSVLSRLLTCVLTWVSLLVHSLAPI